MRHESEIKIWLDRAGPYHPSPQMKSKSTIVSESIAQLIPQTFLCCNFWSKTTELTPAPIFAVLFTLFHPEQISGKKLPSAKITELIPVGFFCGNLAVIWELASPLQTPNFQSSWKWQKIGQQVLKSYFLSLFFAYFLPILGSAVFFCPVEGRVVLKRWLNSRINSQKQFLRPGFLVTIRKRRVTPKLAGPLFLQALVAF